MTENPSYPTNHGTGWTSCIITLIWTYCHNQQTKNILPDGIAPSLGTAFQKSARQKFRYTSGSVGGCRNL
jgi:hypothetical protein